MKPLHKINAKVKNFRVDFHESPMPSIYKFGDTLCEAVFTYKRREYWMLFPVEVEISARGIRRLFTYVHRKAHSFIKNTAFINRLK